jgi:ubiquinone/menaquinone biosynthesis C-methylase UbiE
MQRQSASTQVCPESQIYEGRLTLDDADVLELGCGRAEHTRAIATRHPRARITALEVDPVQHRANLAAGGPPNLRFAAGPAQSIPAPDASFDVVMLFKSLHHVPGDSLDQALREIRRVLRPGGLAYVSEPIFAGDLNEVMRIFHDEQVVRQAAFDALQRAVAAGTLELVDECFFSTPVAFRDFDAFRERMIGVTHTQHKLDEAQWQAVRTTFARYVREDGARFETPMRVDLLRAPSPAS